MGLRESFQQETVAELPIREAVLVTASTSIHEAVNQMRQSQLGCAIVVDDDGKAIGKFTERALIDLLLERKDGLLDLPVGDYIESDGFSATLDTPLCDVCEMIQDRFARFICVVDKDGRPIGLTGQKGVSEYIAEHFPQQVMVQRVGGKPGMDTREGA